MHLKRLLLISSILAFAAFAIYGLNELVNSKIEPVQAAIPSAATPPVTSPTTLTVTNCAGAEIVSTDGQTVTSVEILPAPELPTRVPDAAGFLKTRDGSNLTLQSFLTIPMDAQGATASGGMVTLGVVPDGAVQAGTLIVSGSSVPVPAGDPCGAVQAGATIVSGSGTITAAGGQGDLPQPSTSALPAGAQSVTVIGQAQLDSTGALPELPANQSIQVLSGPAGQSTSQKVEVTDATKIYVDATQMGDLTAGGKQTIQQVLKAGSLDDITQQTMLSVWGHMDGDQLIADLIVCQSPLPMK